MTVRDLLIRTRREVAQEIWLYRSLARWVARRPDMPSGTEPIGYARLSTPMLWLWTIGSAVEVVAVELILRSIDAAWAEAIRLPVLVLGAWGVLWMLGSLAAQKVRPHLLGSTELIVRNGTRAWVRVPLAAVDQVKPFECDYPGVVKTLHHEDDAVLVGVQLRTNLDLVLAEPTTLATSHGPLTVTRVALWVDEPRPVAARLRTTVSAV